MASDALDGKKQGTHDFTLILSGFSELSEEVQDALFEAGCDDALLGVRSGVPFLDFAREARSFPEAVGSALEDVASAGVGARVVRLEPDDLVSASEIARRSGRSRESIRLLAVGSRGPRNFPAPIANLTGASPIWSWAEVAGWFVRHDLDGGVSSTDVSDARFVVRVNEALRDEGFGSSSLVRVLADAGIPER